ncbi:MAG TPA: GNAT family N-acetyltransferase [bacterium]|nr:GNAT family N-acetyltransferase [bacterium]
MKLKFLKEKNLISVFDLDKKIGYLKFSYPCDASKKRNLNFDYIFIKPKYRRQGIATRLLFFALNNFTDVVWISLWTSKEIELNHAHHIYKKVGFKQIAYQADYYAKGVGTRLYVKKIKK